jgi:prepilin-type N-terminal cleavage/methylation domain-containing protein
MRGFTLIELLVAMLVSMVITGALFRLLEPAQQVIGPQLEAADLQQRARVGVEAMRGDLLMAGADRTDGLASPFLQVTPAVLPYRHGASADDPANNVFYRPDTVTVLYVASSADQSALTSHTYYAKADPASGALQLMHYNGANGDFPVLDNVAYLSFAYFGDPRPPTILPPPGAGDDPDTGDEYPPGENCVFGRTDGELVPRLPTLSAGVALVPLGAQAFTDGPWCPSVTTVNRFDADLWRIRQVRVRLRVQTGAAIFRGPAGALFSHAGTARGALRLVPDLDLRFDVAPRNLNAGR